MPRWEPNTRERLRDAALDLFGERGYDNTTAEEIAQRAGVAKSTFFRHFSDKREALFEEQETFDDRIADAIDSAPATSTAFDLIEAALRAIAPLFQSERRGWSRRRHTVITGNRELRERDLLKSEALVTVTAAALRRRDLSEPAAGLAAEICHFVLRTAYADWIDATVEQGFDELVDEVLASVRAALISFDHPARDVGAS
jgi:AcrR family transcriptional regulator